MFKLLVTQDKAGQFECCRAGASGSPVCGRGKSVTEAVGDWAVQSAMVEIRCEPPVVLKEYRIANEYSELKFSQIDKRD